MKTQSKRLLVMLLAALLVVAGPQMAAHAQETAAAPALPRTITVVGEGTVALQPDIAQAQIGVDVSGATARQASAESARIMEAILAALDAQGIAPKDIQTSNYSIFAERPGDPLTGRPGEQVTYRVNNGVAVTIRGDDGMLRPFLERWFSSMYRGMGLETALTLGGLPDDLPFELVAPLGTQVLYSLEQSQGMGTRVALHTPLPAPDALDYLAARLGEQGYAQAETSPTPGDVFGQPDQGVTLCSPDGELGVMVTALPAETASDIDIFILAADNTRCSGAGRDTVASRLLPRLTLPAGQQVQFSSTGSGGSERNAHANSLLTIDLSPAELAAHYSQQLQAAGWQQTSESQTDAVAWSVWQFSDERGRPWVGTLLVAERPAQENALLVQIQIERER